MNPQKVLIQIDDANLYNKIKRINSSISLSRFKYDLLIKKIVPNKCTEIIYYIGEIKRNILRSLKLYN